MAPGDGDPRSVADPAALAGPPVAVETPGGLERTSFTEPGDTGPSEHAVARARARSEERRASMRERIQGYTLIDHEGRSRRFYEDLVLDRTVMIQFMYTTCNGT